MKTLKGLFAIAICFNSFLISGQFNPVSINLINNGVKLDAKFYPSINNRKSPSIILLHGFPGNQNSPLGLAENLNKAGFNILIFNYQGSFLSEGNFSFDNCIDNVNTAINFLSDNENQIKYNIDTSKIVVCGYSFGGTIAIESGMYIKKVRNIISIANDNHSVSIKKVIADNKFREEYMGFIGKFFGPSGPFRGDLKEIMNYSIENIDRYDLVKNAEKLKSKKILLIVGWQDNTSYIEINTIPLYRSLIKFNKENTTIKGFESDHSFGNVTEEVSDSIINWIKDNMK